METVRSADGCTIAFERGGSGPPLVLISGALCDRNSTARLAGRLGSTLTVYRYDRRGRGDSGDSPPYATEREIEDLEALLAATGEPAFVFGHSSGAALALEGAARGQPVRKLVAYEPPYAGVGARASFADELERLVDSGRRSEATARFILNTGAPETQVEQMQASDGWAAMKALAHTLPYDVRLCNGGVVPAARLAQIDCPTLALAGGLSPEWATAAADEIAAAVPGGEARVLEGQTHGVADDVLVPLLNEYFA
jgi:pimeloyl-ACP methyl ester carboxylesterase